MYTLKRISPVIIIVTLLAAHCFGQIVFTCPSSQSLSPVEHGLVWKFQQGDNIFAAVELSSLPEFCDILDYHGDGGNFYWAAGAAAGTIPQALNNGIHVLWQEAGGALLKLDSKEQIAILNPTLELYNIDAAPYINVDAGHTLAKRSGSIRTSSVNTVLDSVNLTNLTETVEHLSGEAPFMLDGNETTLMSRYSYNAQIYTARSYLYNKFASYGYTPELLPFQINSYSGLAFQDDQTGFAGLGSKIIVTADQGLTWQETWTDPAFRRINDISIAHSQYIYAVGQRGLLVRNSPAASGWQPIDIGMNEDLYSVTFPIPSHGWACGADGTIITTTDYGQTWTRQTTPVSHELYTIHFTDMTNGWCAGRDGTLLQTRDSGRTWLQYSLDSKAWINDIEFSTPTQGWLIGTNGTMYQTINNGNDWVSVPLPSSSTLLDIDFYSPKTGYISGRDGTLLQTIDGGLTWTKNESSLSGNINTICALESSLIAGNNTILSYSQDYGRTFKQSQTLSITQHNIAATITGKRFPEKQYIICAHYDAITNNGYTLSMLRSPGADDNASGVAAVLEAARIFAGYEFDYTVKFILFAAEEIGLVGSSTYAAEAYTNNHDIMGVINCDMIGYDSDDNGTLELHVNYGNKVIADSMVVWSELWDLGLHPRLVVARGNSDHYPFMSYGYQGLMCIEDMQSDFNTNYHSGLDLIEYMNLPYFHKYSQLAIGSLASFAGINLPVSDVIEDQRIPDNFTLQPAFPNPFNPTINLTFELRAESRVKIDVINILGQQVKTLFSGRKNAGQHTLSWHGTNTSGSSAPAGIYFVRYRLGTQITAMQKIVFLK